MLSESVIASRSKGCRRDLQLYDFLGKLGEEILPGYEYQILYKDMYSVYGGELDWFYGCRGIYIFTNELWTSFDYFGKKEKAFRIPRSAGKSSMPPGN